MEKTSYHTIKELKLGQARIEVCVESIPTEDQVKKYLTNIYDVVNNIAAKAEKRGVDTSKWFYTTKQIQKLKESPENKFI